MTVWTEIFLSLTQHLCRGKHVQVCCVSGIVKVVKVNSGSSGNQAAAFASVLRVRAFVLSWILPLLISGEIIFWGGRNWHFLATLLVTFFCKIGGGALPSCLFLQEQQTDRLTPYLRGHEDWLLHQWSWDEAADADAFLQELFCFVDLEWAIRQKNSLLSSSFCPSKSMHTCARHTCTRARWNIDENI